MPLTNRQNYLRTITFGGPEWIPCRVHISSASRDQWGKELHAVAKHFPEFFPESDQNEESFVHPTFPPAHRKDEEFEDAWGCVWKSSINGIEGVVIKHPLADLSKMDQYTVPNPLVTADRGAANWDRARELVTSLRQRGEVTYGGVPHGFLFMRFTYLRGFENAMYDLIEEDPRALSLIDQIVEHNRVLVDQWLSMGVELIEFGEDLGTQTSSVISPTMLNKFFVPGYRSLIQPCRQAGCQVAFHSDGYIMDLIDSLIDCGVTIINPQDLCNGIDNLAQHVKGKVAIRLDIDRQKILPYGDRAEIFDLIAEEVRKLGSPEGGLELLAGIYPPTPPENVAALCEAMRKYRTFWWD